MDDKTVLYVLFHNNILRTNLQGYESYVCTTDVASNLLMKCAQYVDDRTKSLNLTISDIDAIFTSEYAEDEEEYELWQEVKALDISDESVIEPAVIKRIKTQIKDYFLAEAFENDDYDRSKLEELYNLLDSLSNLEVDDETVEDLTLDDTDECAEIYERHNTEGITFFDERVSNTLSSGNFDFGTINVVTAAPGNGKTLLILNQGVHVARLGRHTLHLAIGDLTRRQLMIRLLAIITGKTMQEILMLSPKQFKGFIKKAKAKYPNEFEFMHCKCIMPNVFNCAELIKLIKKEQDRLEIHFDQVVVDYDGNIETTVSSSSKNRPKAERESSMYYEGQEIYNGFARFARQNNSVVWMLSQPKITYWDKEKIPLEGLNDSSKKQMIVDFIMSLGKKIKDEDQVTLYVSKNRHGSVDKTFYSTLDGATMHIEPIKDWSD